ncbi:YceH family protein [Euzebya tangerina]|uniref:YceH family protein n=1 Tax=Euzebya tangerina TaxID=591198 RepID=UPI000E3241BA|nr:DUF480 domain-containing protein [Euzebya tangerina]
MRLSDLALRVLGSLIEKAMATPQSYPLSVNALRSAANQTTNRDPVTAYSEDDISAGLKELAAGELIRAAYARRSSTPKYEHLLDQHLEISDAEVAVLGVLMLRGPQTMGELRQRTERLHAFDEIGDVAATLDRLADHPFGALAVEMDRQPGQKETRWAHLLGAEEPSVGAPVEVPTTTPTPDGGGEAGQSEMAALREEVRSLRAEVEAVTARLDQLHTSR